MVCPFDSEGMVLRRSWPHQLCIAHSQVWRILDPQSHYVFVIFRKPIESLPDLSSVESPGQVRGVSDLFVLTIKFHIVLNHGLVIVVTVMRGSYFWVRFNRSPRVHVFILLRIVVLSCIVLIVVVHGHTCVDFILVISVAPALRNLARWKHHVLW